MNILYIANIRLPTEKAHGVAIMKMCEAFVRSGVKVRLVVSRRYTTLAGDPHEIYGIRDRFPIIRLPVIDMFPLTWVRRFAAFAVVSATFYISLFFWLLFRSRRTLVYTRDILTVALAFVLGFDAVYECHSIAKRRGFFFIARRAYKIVVIADTLKRNFLGAGVSESRICTAPSGVDIELFSTELSKEEARTILGIPRDAFVATYTGGFTTLGADKGVYDLFEALRLVPKAYLVAVGGQPYDLIRYGERAEALNIRERVQLVGYVPPQQVARYQRAADVLLMPYPRTHYQHHLSPMKMFEYMASRRPIIASDLPPVREIVSADSALLVPPGDAHATAAALELLRSDPEKGDAMAARAFALVAPYSWEMRGKRIVACLRP